MICATMPCAMSMVFADALGTATWGLVVATALLVVASAVPAIGAILDRRRKRADRITALIPDIHILRTRLNGAIQRHSNPYPNEEELEEWHDDIGKVLGILRPLFKPGRREGLKFTNELYICRHLLTQAYYEYRHASKLDPPEQEAHLDRAQHLCVAAKATLNAAENLLPHRLKTIDGERFWDRFSRLSTEREQSADAELQRARGS